MTTRNPAQSHAGRWKARPGIVLGFAAGRAVLFSPKDQSTHSLSDLAAYVWKAVADGLSSAQMVEELTSRGLDTDTTCKSIGGVLDTWHHQGLIEPEGEGPKAGAGAMRTSRFRSCQIVQIGGIAVRILYTNRDGNVLSMLLSAIEVPGANWVSTLEVTDAGDKTVIWREGRHVATVSRSQAAVTLKNEILKEVLCKAHYALALHAAAIIRDGQVTLLCGPPGAGKSSLTLAALANGWSYGSDDVTLVDSSGKSLGVSLPIGIKAAGRQLAGAFSDAIETAREWLRPDGQLVSFLPVANAAIHWCRVTAVVLLQRSKNGAAVATPVTAEEALAALVAGAFIEGDELTPTGFEALLALINGAKCVRLSYADLPVALQYLREVNE